MVGDQMSNDEIMELQDRAAATRAMLNRVGADLRRMRYARGISIVQAAAETGLSRSTIWRLENGGDVRMFCLMAALDWMRGRK
jgi:DNA-binding XRE family transcriptional regulator